jgi:hypothetical protein
MEVGSEQLAKEYVTDRKAADAKYKNKLLQVQGTVVSVEKRTVVIKEKILTTNWINLSGYKMKPTESPTDRAVRCAARPQLSDKVFLLSKGQMVQVTGKCTSGGTLGAYLEDCDFKELGPSSVITISAEALTKEFAAVGTNDFSVHKKYNNKELIVEGTVFDLDLRQLPPRDSLAGQAQWTVSCTGGRDELQQLKKGQKVRIRGVYEQHSTNRKQVDIGGALVLEAK